MGDPCQPITTKSTLTRQHGSATSSRLAISRRARSTSGQLSMFDLLTSTASISVTSSPASVFGPTPFGAPDGLTVDKYGPALAPANLSARQAKEAGSLTSGTYGRRSSTSSASAALQSSLASRLQAATASTGSTLFKTTWKERTTPSGRSIPAARSTALRTSDSGSVGWPTPTRQDSASSGAAGYSTESGRHSGTTLTDAARYAGWVSPQAADGNGSGLNQHTASLCKQARTLTGWNSPAASDGNGGKRPHPDTTMTGQHPTGRKVNIGLSSQCHIGFLNTEPTRFTASGELLTGSSAEMASGGQLSPAHSRWLMALPPVWDDCAPTATRSTRKPRQPSSAACPDAHASLPSTPTAES